MDSVLNILNSQSNKSNAINSVLNTSSTTTSSSSSTIDSVLNIVTTKTTTGIKKGTFTTASEGTSTQSAAASSTDGTSWASTLKQGTVGSVSIADALPDTFDGKEINPAYILKILIQDKGTNSSKGSEKTKIISAYCPEALQIGITSHFDSFNPMELANQNLVNTCIQTMSGHSVLRGINNIYNWKGGEPLSMQIKLQLFATHQNDMNSAKVDTTDQITKNKITPVKLLKLLEELASLGLPSLPEDNSSNGYLIPPGPLPLKIQYSSPKKSVASTSSNSANASSKSATEPAKTEQINTKNNENKTTMGGGGQFVTIQFGEFMRMDHLIVEKVDIHIPYVMTYSAEAEANVAQAFNQEIETKYKNEPDVQERLNDAKNRLSTAQTNQKSALEQYTSAKNTYDTEKANLATCQENVTTANNNVTTATTNLDNAKTAETKTTKDLENVYNKQKTAEKETTEAFSNAVKAKSDEIYNNNKDAKTGELTADKANESHSQIQSMITSKVKDAISQGAVLSPALIMGLKNSTMSSAATKEAESKAMSEQTSTWTSIKNFFTGKKTESQKADSELQSKINTLQESKQNTATASANAVKATADRIDAEDKLTAATDAQKEANVALNKQQAVTDDAQKSFNTASSKKNAAEKELQDAEANNTSVNTAVDNEAKDMTGKNDATLNKHKHESTQKVMDDRNEYNELSKNRPLPVMADVTLLVKTKSMLTKEMFGKMIRNLEQDDPNTIDLTKLQDGTIKTSANSAAATLDKLGKS